MPQETYVAKIPKAGFGPLERRIAGGPFEFKSVPHAVFSARGEGVVATLYASGKFVVQGATVDTFLARWTELGRSDAAAPRSASKKSSSKTGAGEPALALEPPVTGSDEAGKGDFFGPLVVAAVRADADGLALLEELGVADSKTLTDGRALKLGATLRERVPHSVVRVDPAEYNERYPTYTGLNPFLADLHAEAIGALAQQGENVVVDQFERKGLVRAALGPLASRLTEVPRAERHPAVAAASILARQEFLLGLAELSEEAGVALHKGAGPPVDEVGVRLVRAQGEGALHTFAKLHFKNLQKIRARV
ncbi:MAG: ribonuclease HIII [Planctomycetota bacterium]